MLEDRSIGNLRQEHAGSEQPATRLISGMVVRGTAGRRVSGVSIRVSHVVMGVNHRGGLKRLRKAGRSAGRSSRCHRGSRNQQEQRI